MATATEKEKFFDTLLENIKALENKLDTSESGSLTSTQRNNALWLGALRKTFDDMGDVAGLIAITASCDFSALNNKKGGDA